MEQVSRAWHPARTLKGFVDGFGGGIVGGVAYWLIVIVCQGGAEFPWFRVLAISLAFGCFEAWRVDRRIEA
jgi:hypothetical protein